MQKTLPTPVLGFLITLVMTAVAVAGPTTQPTQQPAKADIYLLPFTALSNDNSLDWAGRAVEQNLLTDLARDKFHAVAGDQADDARAAAKVAGAKYLITGTYQLAEELIRFNGQIIDVASGNVLGSISATGAPRDLFNLEDSLSSQTIQQLAQMASASSKPPAPLPVALQQPMVMQMLQPPAVAQLGIASSYQGSALQEYVDANRTPSTDFAQQLQDAQYRATYSSYNDYGFGYGYGYSGLYSPFYFGGGYGLGLTYSLHYGNYGGHRQHIVNADR